jgi:beta-phosphoglucomutase-like phosphatase (HAD superfamily)
VKPSPYRVRIAVGSLQAEPEDCVFIGDTVTDVLVGLLGGVAIIGYANKPGRPRPLPAPGHEIWLWRRFRTLARIPGSGASSVNGPADSS